MVFRSAFLSAMCCILAAGPLVHAQKGRGNNSAAAQNGWLFSLSEGKQHAGESGKPLMVVIRCET